MERTNFDIDDFTAKMNDTATLNITHPATGLDTGMEITLYCVNSPHWEKVTQELEEENAKFKKTGAEIPKEKSKYDSTTFLAKMTAGWKGVFKSGQELPFNEANARLIYDNWKLKFIREQILLFITRQANFIQE